VLSPAVQLSWLISGPQDEQIIGAFSWQDQVILVGNTNSATLAADRGARNNGGVDVFVRFMSTQGGPGRTIYIGGSGDDRAIAASFNYGRLYIAGETKSRDLPTFVQTDPYGFASPQPFQAAYGGGDSDGFVVGIDALQSRVLFVTYLGGSGADRLTGIANGSTAPVICGETTSIDFPTKRPMQKELAGGSDAVVAALQPDGTSILFSSYWGGSGDDRAVAVASDASANRVVILGESQSADLPVRNPLQGGNAGSLDLFVAKLDFAKPEVIFSTYLGGTEDDRAASVLIGLDGEIIVAGSTASKDFPVANPIYGTFRGGSSDVVLLILSPNGDTLRLSTYWGGSGNDEACCLSMHRFGDVFLAGTTSSIDLPVLKPVQGALAGGADLFVSHFGTGLSHQMTTYFGGPGDDQALGIFLDSSIHLAGSSQGAGFPITQDSPDPPVGGIEGIAVRILPEAVFLPNLGLSGILQRELDFEVGTLPVETNELTISSNDPSRVVFSLNRDELGTASVTIPAKSPKPTVFAQGLGNSGTVRYTVRASDAVSREASITLAPAAFSIRAQFGIYGISDGFSVTTLDEVPLVVDPYVPLPLGATVMVGSTSIRPGVEPITLELPVSDPTVGVVTPASVVIDSQHQKAASLFKPKSPGVTDISVMPPPEFPASAASRLKVTVTLPKLRIQPVELGKDLQREITLRMPTPSYMMYAATLTSADPECLLLASTHKEPGGPVVRVNLQGYSSSFYAQSLCDSGSTTIYAEVDGWERTDVPVTFLPSGIVFLSGGSTVVPSTAVYRTVVYLAGLVPGTNEYSSLGALRPGAAPVSADLKIDDTDVAALVKDKVEFSPGGVGYDFVDIKPLKTGQFEVSVLPPAGFIESPASKFKATFENPR
jgi:hypothetical protein